MAKADKTAQITSDIATGDIGAAIGTSVKILDVGGAAGDPKAVWITAIYGIASTAGTMHVFQSNTTTFVAYSVGTAPHKHSMYLSTTGDGMTGVNIGPFTEDVFCISDGTLVVPAGYVHVDYEAVGTV